MTYYKFTIAVRFESMEESRIFHGIVALSAQDAASDLESAYGEACELVGMLRQEDL